MKYYIIAGEASGDLHGSNLMKHLNELDENADFRFWGGDLMQKVGGELIKHYRDLAFMGFLEVAKNIRTISKNMSFCVNDIKSYNPDVVIFVDYPGFNLRIAKKISSLNLKTFYYISPTVWAWHKSRIKTIKKYISKLFVILPFEKGFYKKYNYNVDYVGHPILDSIADFNTRLNNLSFEDFTKENNLSDKPIIAILPGSRNQEIKKMLPIMLNAIDNLENYQILIAGAPSYNLDYFEQFNLNNNVKVIFNKTYEILKFADAAIVTSGTANLETAILNTPQVVCYKTSKLTYAIAKRLVDLKYFSLTNLIMDKPVIKELLQDNFTAENINIEVNKILFDKEHKQKIFENYNNIKNILGNEGASKRTANLMYKYLIEKDNA